MDAASWRVTGDRTAGREPKDRGWTVREGRLGFVDGKEWIPAETPAVPIPGTVEDRAKLTDAQIADVVTISPNEAWAVGTVTTHVCCDRWSHHREVVMRWDGHRRRLENLGLRGVALHWASADGRGGVRVTAEDGHGRITMLHERGGRWTQSPVRMPPAIRAADITALNGDRLAATLYSDLPEPTATVYGDYPEPTATLYSDPPESATFLYGDPPKSAMSEVIFGPGMTGRAGLGRIAH